MTAAARLALVVLPALAACAPSRPILVQPTPLAPLTDSRLAVAAQGTDLGVGGFVVAGPVRPLDVYAFGAEIGTPQSVQDASGRTVERGRYAETGVGIRATARDADGSWLSVSLEGGRGTTEGAGAIPSGRERCGLFFCDEAPLGQYTADATRGGVIGAIGTSRPIPPLIGTAPGEVAVAGVVRYDRRWLRDVMAEPFGPEPLPAVPSTRMVQTVGWGVVVQLRQEAFAAELQVQSAGRLGGADELGVRSTLATVGVVLELGRARARCARP